MFWLSDKGVRNWEGSWKYPLSMIVHNEATVLEQWTSMYSICSDIWFLIWLFVVLFTNTSFYIYQARLHNIKLKTCFLLILFIHQCMKFIYEWHLVLNLLFDMKLNRIFRTIFNCILFVSFFLCIGFQEFRWWWIDRTISSTTS